MTTEENLKKVIKKIDSTPDETTMKRWMDRKEAIDVVIEKSGDKEQDALIDEYEQIKYDYDNYFVSGYKCETSIDYLPGMLQEKANEILDRIDELK